jgi:hypothetical protein
MFVCWLLPRENETTAARERKEGERERRREEREGGRERERWLRV